MTTPLQQDEEEEEHLCLLYLGEHQEREGENGVCHHLMRTGPKMRNPVHTNSTHIDHQFVFLVCAQLACLQSTQSQISIMWIHAGGEATMNWGCLL